MYPQKWERQSDIFDIWISNALRLPRLYQLNFQKIFFDIFSLYVNIRTIAKTIFRQKV